LSVARPLRSTLEQVADALPDIVMLGLGILIFAVFIGPITGFIGNIRGLVGDVSTPATVGTTGTVGHVQSTGPGNVTPYRVAPLVGPFTGNRYAWRNAYSVPSTPINRFFRQLYYEKMQ